MNESMTPRLIITHWLGDRHPSPNAPRNTTKPQEVNGSEKMVILETRFLWIVYKAT